MHFEIRRKGQGKEADLLGGGGLGGFGGGDSHMKGAGMLEV